VNNNQPNVLRTHFEPTSKNISPNEMPVEEMGVKANRARHIVKKISG
jgi:hypothetical protein